MKMSLPFPPVFPSVEANKGDFKKIIWKTYNPHF